ncbi:MAG: hypothetical protein IPM83_03710 [Ignavibacteria bacterium]|nr:hypothetical protein [Ignavibacteria bacterium]
MNKLIPPRGHVYAVGHVAAHAQKGSGAAWRVTTQDDFASIRYPQDRGRVVLANGAKVWSHNTTTGQLEWTIEVPDHESDGVALVMLRIGSYELKQRTVFSVMLLQMVRSCGSLR